MPGSSLRPSRGECPVVPRWASRQLPPDRMTAAAPCHLPRPATSRARVPDLLPRSGAEPWGREPSLPTSAHGAELPVHSGLRPRFQGPWPIGARYHGDDGRPRRRGLTPAGSSGHWKRGGQASARGLSPSQTDLLSF